MGGLRLRPEQSAKLVGSRRRLLSRLAGLRQARESAVMAFSMAVLQQHKVRPGVCRPDQCSMAAWEAVWPVAGQGERYHGLWRGRHSTAQRAARLCNLGMLYLLDAWHSASGLC